MRFLRQSLTGLLLFALTLGLLFFAGQVVVSAVQERITKQVRAPDRRERSFTVTVVRAQSETVTPILTAYGEVQSSQTLEIRAKTSGTLVELAENFEEGGVVQQGTQLALVDPTNAQFAMNRAASELKDSQAETREAARALDLAKDELTAAIDQAALRDKAFQRQSDLQGRGVGTAAAVEQSELTAAQARQTVIVARRAVAAAEARVDQAATRMARSEIAHQEAKQRLDDTRVIAGFSGSLTDVNVVQGRLVSANEHLGTLIDIDALEVSFRVSTAQYGRLVDSSGALIKAPVTAMLATSESALSVMGRIIRDGAAVGANGTGRVLFATLDSAGALKPGDFVTVHVAEPPLENVLRLPAAALGADGQVLVLGEEDRLRAVSVTLMRRQGDDILVRAPELDGAQVVTERTPLLGEGIKVAPRLVDLGAQEAGTAGKEKVATRQKPENEG